MTRFTPALGRSVFLREGTMDAETWDATFIHQYHVPPGLRPRTVLDLGSNIGLTVAHYKELWPQAKVVGVEMDEANASLARLNGADVRDYAISVHDGAGGFDRTGSEAGFHLSPAGSVGVRTVSLRQAILTEFGPDGVDFVKMDIEGEEWSVLRHPDWAPLVRALLVEFHPRFEGEPDPQILEEAIGLVQAAGFESVVWHDVHPRAVFAR